MSLFFNMLEQWGASGRGSTESEYYLQLHFKPKLNHYNKVTKKCKYKLTDYCHMRGKFENEQQRGKSLENLGCVCKWDGDKGTGTSGRVCGDLGLRDARRGTCGHQVWDAGTCRTGTRGRQTQGRRGRGMWIIVATVGGKCDISHFPREYVLVKSAHPALLRVPSCLFTKRRLGEDPLY